MRCENCARISEKVRDNAKFMMCGSCKTKLDFAVHYCSKVCQKADWPNHKRHCGKEKILKDPRGTALDRAWSRHEIPDYMLPTTGDPDENGLFPETSYGFGNPHPSRPHSPALQRQVSLITADKEADYFLFDEMDRPVRVEIPDMWVRMAFRVYRANAMFSAKEEGVEVIAEYLIKFMGRQPGLSRGKILNQFAKEYGRHFPAKIARWEKTKMEGYEPGVTIVELMSRNIAANAPTMWTLLERR